MNEAEPAEAGVRIIRVDAKAGRVGDSLAMSRRLLRVRSIVQLCDSGAGKQGGQGNARAMARR
jgi:hypothetical protein